MVTFLAGGTGTPRLLAGADPVFDPSETTVLANTGDDVEISGHLVCPDLDTVLFLRGDVLDRETWWGIAEDTTETHSRLHDLAAAADLDTDPRYLDPAAQTTGRRISRWRRFSGVAEFMLIGDRDRAIHLTRTGLIDEGRSLSEATQVLADAYDLTIDLLPMSNDPVATLVHTEDGTMHFQEWWVHRGGEPAPASVEFRGIEDAGIVASAKEALRDPVVIGPSNPITSIGPMLGLADAGFERRLHETAVVAVSPFVEDRVFSGPAAALMDAAGYRPSTAGLAEAYPFADAFVLDDADSTDLDRPVVHTDIEMADETDAERVARACADALAEVS